MLKTLIWTYLCLFVILPVIAVATYFDTKGSGWFEGADFAFVFGFYNTGLIWVVGVLALGLFTLAVRLGRRADRRARKRQGPSY